MSKIVRKTQPVVLAQNGQKVPYTVDFSILGDGSLPAALTGLTWSILSGAAINTPVLSSELLTNGNMELDANWGNQGSPTTNERSNEQAHGGTYSRKIVSDAVGEGCVQTKAVTSDLWYILDGYLYVAAGSARIADVNSKIILPYNLDKSAEEAWVQSKMAGPCTSAGFAYICPNARTAVSTFYADDQSLKSAAVPQLGFYAKFNLFNVQVKGAWTIPTGLAAGVWACRDGNGLNGLIATHDGTYAKLWKVLNGVISLLLTSTCAYSAGANVEIRKSGTAIQLFYNDVQRGSNQTVTDVSIIYNKYHGAFSTDPSCTCTSFSVLPN